MWLRFDYCLLGLASVALWIGALLAPIKEVSLSIPFPTAYVTGPSYGYEVAEEGWLGPIELAVGWYANIPLFVCLARMLAGRRPGRIWTVTALGLAATALIPHLHIDIEYATVWAICSGPALWLWLACFAPVVVAEFALPCAESRSLRTTVQTAKVASD